MIVDRCICRNVTFQDLKAVAEQGSADIDSLTRATGCGSSCRLCRTYVMLMLSTGQTAFPVLSPKQIAQMLGDRYSGS